MKKEYKVYKVSKEYTCSCGCNETIKLKESCYIIMGDFIKINHLKQYLKTQNEE